jgi:hypothetical protein
MPAAWAAWRVAERAPEVAWHASALRGLAAVHDLPQEHALAGAALLSAGVALL